MEIVPPERYPGESFAELEQFLGAAQERARARGHHQLVSISKAVGHIEPLAVLDSIFEPEERHFFLERPEDGMAVAGADAVVARHFEGPRRMLEAKAWVAGVLGETVALGDLDRPFAGPHFFAGFAFADRGKPGDLFEPATVFVPRWQVGRQGGACTATANLVVEPESPVGELARRVWGAHQRFSSFDYARFPERPPWPREEVVVTEPGGAGGFERIVGEALGMIASGGVRKIVLARALDLEARRALEPLAAVDRLRQRFPGCSTFSIANGRGQSFIGSTPELLVRLRGGQLATMALAGTARRGATPEEDQLLGLGLLASGKDRHEHRLVVEAILRRLGRTGTAARITAETGLRKLPNVQHLHTPIAGEAVRGKTLFDYLQALHPTPAVGGVPRAETQRRIPLLEPFDRSLYAGAVGFADSRGEGELHVAIRCALVDGKRARVYAGSGIVEGSEPARERAETDLKLEALLSILQV